MAETANRAGSPWDARMDMNRVQLSLEMAPNASPAVSTVAVASDLAVLARQAYDRAVDQWKRWWWGVRIVASWGTSIVDQHMPQLSRRADGGVHRWPRQASRTRSMTARTRSRASARGTPDISSWS